MKRNNLDDDLTMDDKLIEAEGTESGSVGVFINKLFYLLQIISLLKKLIVFKF